MNDFPGRVRSSNADGSVEVAARRHRPVEEAMRVAKVPGRAAFLR